jgi:predicted RNase H-like HicB family nuclease
MPPCIARSFSCYAVAVDANTYHVQADWDPAAGVWVATSVDVPGLVTEAETIEELTIRLRTMIPELLEANGLLSANISSDSIAFELTSHRQELVPLAS